MLKSPELRPLPEPYVVMDRSFFRRRPNRHRNRNKFYHKIQTKTQKKPNINRKV